MVDTNEDLKKKYQETKKLYLEDMQRALNLAYAEGLIDAAEIAWSDDVDQPWESYGLYHNTEVAQDTAKAISKAILEEAKKWVND